MRTYSRKILHQEIQDVHTLCRLCLGPCTGEDALPIFKDATDNGCGPLTFRIMICVGLEMKQDNHLPNQICQSCHMELEQCYSFRKKCEVSYQKLKSHSAAVQMKEIKEVKQELEATPEPNIYKTISINESDETCTIEQETDLVYMVNIDGSVKICESLSQVNKDNLLVDMEKENSQEANIQFTAPVIESQDKICDENPVQSNNLQLFLQNCVENENDVQNLAESEIYFCSEAEASNLIISESKEMEEQPSLEIENEDISTFLRNMLIKVGVLTYKETGLEIKGGVNLIQLQTGDGKEVTMEVMEEDDVQEQSEQESEDDNQELMHEIDVTKENKPSEVDEDSIIVLSAGSGGSGGMACGLCRVCGRVFSTRNSAARHARAVHERIKPYACSVCGRRFAQKGVCARHELTHEKIRPFACQLCPKSFTQRTGLLLHTRSHAAPARRPLSLHRCPHCPKVFLHGSGLSRHLKIHNGRTTQCGIGGCWRAFHDSCALRRHRMTHQPRTDARGNQ